MAVEPAINKEERARLREQILAEKYIDRWRRINAKNWGEDIENPFSNLDEKGKAKLRPLGVDVERLLKLQARLLTGEYRGADMKEFVNKDPDTILVFGKGFKTHGKVYSLGPVLAVKDAELYRVVSADLVWCVEKSFFSRHAAGSPLIITGKDDEYGWRRPPGFPKFVVKDKSEEGNAKANEDSPEKKTLLEQIRLQSGVDVKDVAKRVPNPFTNLTAEGKAKLRARGLSPENLLKLSALFLTGEYFGDNYKDFINRDRDTILVLGKGFATHGHVCSAGPILAIDDAHFMGRVMGADLVWFVDRSFPRHDVVGLPVVFGPTAFPGQVIAKTENLWHGDYGWRRPPNYPPKP